MEEAELFNSSLPGRWHSDLGSPGPPSALSFAVRSAQPCKLGLLMFYFALSWLQAVPLCRDVPLSHRRGCSLLCQLSALISYQPLNDTPLIGACSLIYINLYLFCSLLSPG